MSENQDFTPEERALMDQFEPWLKDGGPAALVIRELLEPVEGPDGVVFPATFAAEQGNNPDRFRGGYNIDEFPDGTNVCLIDTVGSQANRIEPMFGRKEYAGLVPEVTIKINEERTVNLLEVGHRAGDALVRCSELQEELHKAFESQLKGNDEPLAKIAPTSLVFGVWDSRDTQAKLPRLLASTIRAFDVTKLTRAAVYTPPVNYAELDVFSEADKEKAEDDNKSPLAKRGFVHNPASGSPGGVIAGSGIRRDATLSIAALRRLTADNDDATKKLRQYILGLALVALTSEQDTYLRQGCNLVPAEEGNSRTFQIVQSSGRRDAFSLSHEDARTYATAAAKEFVVGENRNVDFDKKRAKRDITEKINGGKVLSVDAEARRFTLKFVVDQNDQEIEVVANDATKFKKGRADTTFDESVVVGVTLDVEIAKGVATKISRKK